MTVAHSRVVVFKTANELVVVCACVQFFVKPSEFVTTMRRPGSPFKIRESTAHDNRISLEHTLRRFTTENIDHCMCVTIGRIRSVWISSRTVNTKFVVAVNDKIIQERITRIVVAYQMVHPGHEKSSRHLSRNFQWLCVAVVQCDWTVTHTFCHSQLCLTCLRHQQRMCRLQNFMWMHAPGYHHVRFLQSYGHGNLQLSTGLARSNAIESSCLPIHPNRVNTPNLHLRFSVLSPNFTVTTTFAPVINKSPKHRHLQLDQRLVNSVFGFHWNA